MRTRNVMPGTTNIDPPHVRDGKARLRAKRPLQYPFDRIALAGRALESLRNDLVDEDDLMTAEEVQCIINHLTGGDEHVVNVPVEPADDGRSFVFGGQPYYTGVVDADALCESCELEILSGWESYVTTGVGWAKQKVMCRWCGRDEIKIQEGSNG